MLTFIIMLSMGCLDIIIYVHIYAGVNEDETYTSLKQPTLVQDKVYTEVNTHAVYTSLDPQTTRKDGEYTHVLTKESTLDVTPKQQCTSHSRVVGGGAHSTSGDTMYTALDPQTTQSDTTYTPLNGAGLLNHDTYINVVDGHEGVSETDCTTCICVSVHIYPLHMILHYFRNLCMWRLELLRNRRCCPL